jgi:hypothetical protein
MTTANKMTAWKLSRHATVQLLSAQSAFADSPSSYNWTQTLRTMFVYQQVQYLLSHGMLFRLDALCDELTALPIEKWDDAISLYSVNMTVSDAIATHAIKA